MILERFSQSNKFWKKSLKVFWDIQVWVQYPSLGTSWECPDNVLINLPGTSLERQIRTSPGRHFRTSPERQTETSPGRSNRIFRGRPGDIGGGRPWDVLRTNICRVSFEWFRNICEEKKNQKYGRERYKNLPEEEKQNRV